MRAFAYDRPLGNKCLLVAYSSQNNNNNVNKDARLCRTKTIGPTTATISLDDLWLVSLRGTEREDVFDVCVHYHGPQSSSSSSYVW